MVGDDGQHLVFDVSRRPDLRQELTGRLHPGFGVPVAADSPLCIGFGVHGLTQVVQHRRQDNNGPVLLPEPVPYADRSRRVGRQRQVEVHRSFGMPEGSCSTPRTAARAGKCISHPVACRASSALDGFTDFAASLENSLQTRSLDSSA